ncbi:MarR family winged helix-turn-helix transcriptional regulator [Terriglobus aquaticus]|uniref:MarR family winged helix-turn-helix transcriptional regulator n=1 Tax=Terriglobus aquaticus TaxID=940139 RepID=A0ABW9KMW2_9BACT|nr:MarR family transcriptional regulator [Terriglobus aquaticus]
MAQFEVLTLLRHHECNGRAIARMLSLDTTTVSRNLKLLLAAGLVRSRPGSSDARQILYCLSSSGAALLRKAEPHWATAQSKMAARLNRPLAQMMRSLKKLEEAAS